MKPKPKTRRRTGTTTGPNVTVNLTINYPAIVFYVAPGGANVKSSPAGGRIKTTGFAESVYTDAIGLRWLSQPSQAFFDYVLRDFMARRKEESKDSEEAR